VRRLVACACFLWACLNPQPYSPNTPAPQVRLLFPSARGLKVEWHSIVKIGQSLYREAPGVDPFRPDQVTPIENFFLAGSYTKQVRTGRRARRARGVGRGGWLVAAAVSDCVIGSLQVDCTPDLPTCAHHHPPPPPTPSPHPGLH
jgi:uncharacterized protein with NAD-binding domain and iron-sulfur cluster